MKVLYLVERFPVFSETFIIDEIAGHVEAGLDVVVASLKGQEHGDYPFEQSPLFGRTDLVFLEGNAETAADKFRLIARALLANPKAFLRLRGSGLSIREMAQAALVERLVKSRFDIIHCHYGYIGRVGLGLRKLAGSRPPLFITFHAHDLLKQWYLPLASFYRPVFESDATLLPISDHWRKLLVSSGADPSRTKVHHMGVLLPSARAKSEDEGAKRGGTAQIVMTGRLVEKKGHLFALDAFERIEDTVDFHCTIVGGGPLLETVKKEVRARGLEEKVTLLGSVQHEIALRTLDRADLFLLPSVTATNGDQEGIPVALMEAMAKGIPVVSTRHTGIPELIEHGRSGLLCEEHDAEGLAENIESLCRDPVLRERLAKAGRKKVAAEFERQELGRTLRRYYAEALTRN
ncbi:glycosyltransferase [Altererythrobacter aurantiacus]|uniref:Glycosyltransferase n=1 Tax=Parapontixanthobacter aurantiacus TaxID=1463599 RepID=A0A844ZGA6_9SPHN|nr:glycosyltransferase [Parapontixanthobacter aurantiacus]